MKKVFCALLAALTLLAAAVVPAYAVDSSKSYLFELSIDGGDTKHAAAGDIDLQKRSEPVDLAALASAQAFLLP